MTPERMTYLDGARLYPWCFAGHHLQGMWCGVLVYFDLWLPALLWTLLFVAYQGLSVIRKGDSAGLDVMDFMAGLGVSATVAHILGGLI